MSGSSGLVWLRTWLTGSHAILRPGYEVSLLSKRKGYSAWLTKRQVNEARQSRCPSRNPVLCDCEAPGADEQVCLSCLTSLAFNCPPSLPPITVSTQISQEKVTRPTSGWSGFGDSPSHCWSPWPWQLQEKIDQSGEVVVGQSETRTRIWTSGQLDKTLKTHLA